MNLIQFPRCAKLAKKLETFKTKTFVFHCQGRDGHVNQYRVTARNQSEAAQYLSRRRGIDLPYQLLRITEE